MSEVPTEKKKPSSGFKFLLDFGPLIVFFAVYSLADPVTVGGEVYKPIVVAGVALAALTLVTLTISYIRFRHIPMMPLVSGVLVVFFVTLSVVFNDDFFIKIKPTIVYCLFAVALLGGLAMGKPLLAKLFDGAFQLDDAGWRALTLRWGLFFIAMAVLNEVIWRNFSVETWVTVKTFGFLPVTILFAFSQMPLITRHALETEGEAE